VTPLTLLLRKYCNKGYRK